MIIDVSHKPVLLIPDDVPEALVVRSIADRDATGLVLRYDPVTAKHKCLQPGASLTRGSSTCHETFLPLIETWASYMTGSIVEEMTPSQLTNSIESRSLFITLEGRAGPRWGTPRMTKIHEPYEVVSICTDPVSKATSTWRIGITLEATSKSLWKVHVIDVSTGAMFASIALRGLDPEAKPVLPIQRRTRKVAIGTAWAKLVDDD